MRKVLLFLVVFISVLALILRFGYQPLTELLGIKQRAGIRVEANKKADVYLNEKKVGTTPLQDENLTEGEYLVKLVPHSENEATASAKEWKGYIKLNGGTLTVVNRDLSLVDNEASGEVITLDPGRGVTVISTPNDAEVTLDGKVVGRTPLSISNVSSGEHQFMVTKGNYLNRSIRANLIDGFNLNLSVDLAMTEPDLTKLPTIPTVAANQLVVKRTPVGFLRVRSSNSTQAQELDRVATGDVLTLLEELPEWYKIKTSDGVEGYVSAIYVEKKTN